MGNSKGTRGPMGHKILRAVPKLELAVVLLHSVELVCHIYTFQ